MSRTAFGAEEIRLVVGGPIAVSISGDALETFAQTGEIPPNLRPYARFLDDGNRQQLREGLNRSAPLSVSTVGHVAYSPPRSRHPIQPGQSAAYPP
ncbi:MAG: alpha/beta hydrolase [Leptolyngbyaceae cyanobacterium SM2_5_2]|nr:alpha/beta hydrolase [Leptolyngbyaceae cyanobacterium SM2_5_2]